MVEFEALEQSYAPDAHDLFVAVTYGQLNRLRTRLAEAAKVKGYRLASYVSSRAFVWRNVTFGEHCFVFEDNTVQPFVRIGDNVVLWSGNHIGHHCAHRGQLLRVVARGRVGLCADRREQLSRCQRRPRSTTSRSAATTGSGHPGSPGKYADGELYGGTQTGGGARVGARFFKVKT